MSTQATKSISFKPSPVGILTVTVIWAQNLVNNHHIHKPNPYVKLKLTGSESPSKRTSVRKNNLNPEWNEVFKIIVTDLEAQELQINVLDFEQVGMHHNLGTNSIPLKELTPNESKIITLDLLYEDINVKNAGQIVVNLNYNPFKEGECVQIEMAEETSIFEKAKEGLPGGGGLLIVIIHEAYNLEGKHHMNPYVDIIFGGEERKTEVVKKNKDPIWDQEFEFLCEEPPIDDTMHVEVLSKPPKKGLIYSKESLGYADISLGDVVKSKRTNETYRLTDSNSGQIQIVMQWLSH